MSYFNIRAYGLLLNADDEILLSDERQYGQEFTKFPGGGLEFGEGLRDGLIREYHEECGIAIEVLQHIHTTDVYIHSAFNDSQLIAVYYQVRASAEELASIKVREMRFDFGRHPSGDPDEAIQVFRWIPVSQMTEEELTFEIDRAAWRAFTEQRNVSDQPR